MKNTKRSVTVKIIIGYFLAVVLALISFWVVNQQVDNYTRINKIKNENNEMLSLIGEVITGLYEAESFTRNIIQTSNERKFKSYTSTIDTVLSRINLLSELSYDAIQAQKIDSIKLLLDSKNKNLKELIQIYRQRKQKGIYAQAIDELKKADASFEDKDVKKRYANLRPEFRERMINIVNLINEDNSKRLTNQTMDSVTTTVKQVLEGLEKKDNRYKKEISYKESKLLKNDRIISRQLRALLSSIDRNERREYFSRLEASNQVLSQTSNFILVVVAISLIIAVIFLYLITKDVSKSQKYRTDLEQEKVYTESLLKTRESLINTVTHDLRSPLNSVIGYSDLLEKTGLNTKQKHYLNHLKKSSDYILHLVNDLLDLSKLEAGKMAIERLPFSPKELIENTISSIIPIQETKNLDIKILIDDSLDQQFVSDPFRIKQVLTNLFSNAYKFTDSGSIVIKGWVIENTLDEKQLAISIKDTGIGISKKQQKHIFEEFSQADNKTEKRYGGFGLGLAITKKIIRLLKGKITLESQINKGSTFTIYIPIQPSTSVKIEEEKEILSFASDTDVHLLIVDDDPSQLALTGEVLSIAGLTYDKSESVSEAIDLLKKNTYSLILTDIQMPEMDGFELLKVVKAIERFKHIPVIAVSGIANTTIQDFKNIGFSNGLRKPYTPKELTDIIAQTLNIEPVAYASLSYESEHENKEYSLNDLMLFAHGDMDSLYTILDTFYESTIRNVKDLNAFVDDKKIDAIKKVSHKMLPMFKQIKAKKIIPILTKLEHPDQYELNQQEILRLSRVCIEEINTLIQKLKVEV